MIENEIENEDDLLEVEKPFEIIYLMELKVPGSDGWSTVPWAQPSKERAQEDMKTYEYRQRNSENKTEYRIVEFRRSDFTN